jgi:hypothetical protein
MSQISKQKYITINNFLKPIENCEWKNISRGNHRNTKERLLCFDYHENRKKSKGTAVCFPFFPRLPPRDYKYLIIFIFETFIC